MKPPQREFEKIDTSDFIPAVIEDIKYDETHEFKGKHAKVGPAVRFIFRLEGYADPKPSRWMTFNYSEKSNLYQKYLTNLVEGAHEYMDFDMDSLKGMKIKLMYKDDPKNPSYQNIDLVRAVSPKIKVATPAKPKSELADVETTDDDEVPF